MDIPCPSSPFSCFYPGLPAVTVSARDFLFSDPIAVPLSPVFYRDLGVPPPLSLGTWNQSFPLCMNESGRKFFFSPFIQRRAPAPFCLGFKRDDDLFSPFPFWFTLQTLGKALFPSRPILFCRFRGLSTKLDPFFRLAPLWIWMGGLLFDTFFFFPM